MKKWLKDDLSLSEAIKTASVSGFRAFLIALDMIYCKTRFRSTYDEYCFYEYQNLKNRYRKNYLLRRHQREKYRLVDNDSEQKLKKKESQYALFEDMIKREWIKVTPQNMCEVESFIKKHGKVIFKPTNGSQGCGISLFSEAEIKTSFLQKFAEIAINNYICEGYVVQHPKMAELNPYSLNTIRIITLCDGKTMKFISAGLRTGADNGICDNMSIGGIGGAVDIETGIVFTPGVDFKKNRYQYHPVSGTQIIGFEIPYWDEVKKMVKECALRVEKTAVVGWDIAITEEGPCLIEANNRPAGRLVQIATNKPMGAEVIDYIKRNGKKRKKKRNKK